MEGYRRALREAGLPVEDQLVFTAGVTIEDGRKAAVQMLGEAARPTAIQAVSDLVAMGVASILTQQGLRIPEDVSLAGFGNHLAGEHARVPLTTVDQPRYALGVAAVECMLRQLKGEKPETKRLQSEPLFRSSTAAPGASRAARQLAPGPGRSADAA